MPKKKFNKRTRSVAPRFGTQTVCAPCLDARWPQVYKVTKHTISFHWVSCGGTSFCKLHLEFFQLLRVVTNQVLNESGCFYNLLHLFSCIRWWSSQIIRIRRLLATTTLSPECYTVIVLSCLWGSQLRLQSSHRSSLVCRNPPPVYLQSVIIPASQRAWQGSLS